MENKPPVNVLFVSRRNNFRSLLAEACLAHLSKGRFRAFSCGTPMHLGEVPHPMAVTALINASIPATGLRCKSWGEYTRAGAPRMDFVITLDSGVDALVPHWPGQPETALWSYPDVLTGPSAPEGIGVAAVQALYSLRRRLELLVSLPIRTADKAMLRGDIRDMAYMN